jgi:predicted transcriptional regulator
VLTLVKRLEDKGLVAREGEKEGKAFIYRPTRTSESAPRRLVRQVVDRLFGGNSVALVASLMETRKPTPAELAELGKLLERLRREQGGRAAKTERKV